MVEPGSPAAIIGPPDPREDWRIAPTAHADRYRAAAPAFADVLQSEAVVRGARRYEECDAEAVSAQASFRSLAEPTNEWVLAATVAGAVVLVTQVLFPGHLLVGLAGIAAAITGIGALIYVSLLRDRNDLGRWKRARAEAERARVDYFGEVIEGCGERSELAPLGFEYMRRYLYGSQLAYFEMRGPQHADAARSLKDRVSVLRATSVGLLGLGGAGAIIEPQVALFAAVAGGVSAVASYFAAEEQWNQDDKNAAAYRSARRELEDLGPFLGDVASSPPEALGKSSALAHGAIRRVLMAEHREWLEDFSDRQAAVDDLQDRLKTVGKSGEDSR